MPETIAFTVSPSIIRHLIERQAGTLPKAILELITNGIDAGASRIDVNFNGDSQITVKDDGRGFRTRDEIQRHFADFGFDHTTEQELALGRINGRFGMGRSQVYGFGRSVWRTHQFIMDVDIRSNRDLAFELSESQNAPVSGCQIDIELYKPMTNVDRATVVRTLRDHVKYAPSSIYVDGKQVNKDLTEMRWTAETDRLLFLQRDSATCGLEVHNLGIFVARYPQSTMGVSGVVISKIPHSFKVTMSRTDVHRTCDLWAEMKTMLAPFKAKRQRRRQLTDDDRMNMVREWLWAPTINEEALRRARLFETAKGNYMTLNMLIQHANGTVGFAGRRGDRVAEAIHESRAMAVLGTSLKDWIGAESDDDVIEALNAMHKRAFWQRRHFSKGDLDALRASYNDTLQTVPTRQYSKVQQAQIGAVSSIASDLANAVEHQQDRICTGGPRNITLGTSDTALAWTDGCNTICVEKGFLSTCINDGMDGILRLVAVLVHEQIHTVADTDKSHSHPPEFYEAFENVITGRSGLFRMAAKVMKRYDELRDKLGLEGTLKGAKHMDQLAAVASSS